MDLELSVEHEAFRRRVRAWLKANLPKREPDDAIRGYGDPARVQRLKAWQRRLYEGGYVAMSLDNAPAVSAGGGARKQGALAGR